MDEIDIDKCPVCKGKGRIPATMPELFKIIDMTQSGNQKKAILRAWILNGKTVLCECQK